MKIFLVMALVSQPVLALADSTSTAPARPTEPQPTQELKDMTQRLGLTQAQQDKIAPLLVAEAKARKSIDDNKTLSEQQRFVQEGMIHRATLQQMQTVFTPGQKALMEQGQDQPGTSPTHP